MIAIRNNVYAHLVAEGRFALDTDDSGNSLSSFHSASRFLWIFQGKSGVHHCNFYHQLKARAAIASKTKSQCGAFIFPTENLPNFHFR